ncbi:TetR/AcrR family transcriptional regulator [Streptomyces sp. A30]|uniref:TetR/AcrR family transcriptional regulator n=1 Tax=Streptomyces sp. A30 TaxID=2789273 RepID=UPI003980B8FA
MSETSPPGSRPQRADARENLQQILQAAQAVFAERGYEVSIEEVARRSGLGMGTIYRHFPNKRSLVERVATDSMKKTSAEVERATVEETDTWAAFTRVMRYMARVGSSQLVPVSRRRATESGPELIAARTALLADLDALVARAQEVEVLRKDVSAFDLVLMMVSLPPGIPDGEADGTPADLPGRQLSVLLDGLRAPGAETLPEPASTRRDIDVFFRTRFGL